ncbi:ATP-binding protein [Aliikangiella sp. IMCC44359]|uniref:ATP-binding protein n=1 Tax=Aliikangiella sp. IMCC44359 TaxID=3459125 RepID=UPI00403ADE25
MSLFYQTYRTALKAIGNIRALIFVVLCAVTGFALNLIPVKLFGDLTLILGPAFSLLVALSIGPLAGALTAFVATLALVYSWGNWYGLFIFVPEAFVVGWLYRKDWNELLAVVVYWLIFGVVFVLFSIFMDSDPELALDLVGTYLMNSCLYTLSASALLWFFSVPKWLKLEFNRSYTMRTQIFTILMVSMTIPLASFSIYDAKKTQQDRVIQIKSDLTNASQMIAQKVTLYLKENQLAVQKQSEILSLHSDKKLALSKHLVEFHRKNPAFLTALIANLDGQLTAYSPYPVISTQKKIDNGDYFKAAVNGQVFVSNIIRDPRLGAEATVTISAPIFSPLNNEVLGILQGALDLKLLGKVLEQKSPLLFPRQTFIVDANGVIVYAPPGSSKKLLDKVELDDSHLADNIDFNHNAFLLEPAISAEAMLPNQWKVLSYYSVNDFNQYSRIRYRELLLALLVIVIIIASLAAFISNQINGPISWLLKRTVNFNVAGENIKPIEISPLVPSEMVTLMRAHESAERRLTLAFKSEKFHQIKRARAEKANEAKSDFLSSMSHELRTPLNAISGFSQLLNTDDSIVGDARVMAKEIYFASQYLMLLINDILDLSKIESGQLSLNIEELDVCSTLNQSLPLLEGLAEVNGIEITVHNELSKKVFADELRLKQILINLISNGIKYNRKNGRVMVSLYQYDESSCCIDVADTGHGINTHQINELFAPFNRLSNEQSTIEGYGIGLTVTKQLVELMGGSIQVESELEVGSCFKVFLPLSEKLMVEEADISEDNIALLSSELKKCSILYIEDNYTNAHVMQKAMERFSQIKYVHESSGQTGIERLANETFDFVFLDITLPDYDGFSVLSRIKRDFSQQFDHVFAISANALTEDIEKGLVAGFDEYITKPIRFDLLFRLMLARQSLTES